LWHACCLLLPLFPLGLWLLYFHATYGVWLPGWVYPPARVLAADPFFQVIMSRPWYYFGWALLRINPVLLLGMGAAAWQLLRAARLGDRFWSFLALWSLFYLVFISLACTHGLGFMLRHLVPALPLAWFAVFLWAERQEEKRPKPLTILAAGYLLALLLLTVYQTVLSPVHDLSL
jgi:hypothetical protein